MKIIQSFAAFDEGSPYLINKRKDYPALNLYSFLLSYITINKFYGDIQMFCNEKAYQDFIKYIPYDKIIIREHDKGYRMWSTYKIDAMKTLNDDFIHVDSDIFLSQPVFDNFIDMEYNIEVMVQNITPMSRNGIKDFGFRNKDFLADTKILTKPFDGRSMICGTMGLKKNVQEYYFAGVDVFYEAMLKLGVENITEPSMLLEEQLLYYITLENDFTCYSILPEELILSHGLLKGGDMLGYLHVWMGLKFKREIIDMIRKKIFHDFPEYYHIIEKYEQDVLKDNKVFNHMNFQKLTT